jgi:hypothetical protein
MEMLATLPSPCVVDDEGQSPFNVAIRGKNEAVVNLLLESDEALEFAPAAHDSESAKLMKFIYQSEGIDDIEVAERRVLEAIDGPPSLHRTPLLQACRYGNVDAITKLIARGAKLTAKDLLGETPLTLCVRTGGPDLARHFIECCIDANRQFPLTAEALRNLCGSQDIYDLAIEQGRPDAAAKRFIFNFACATLHRATITKMLADGFAINSAITSEANPVVELLTSRLAWNYEAAQWRKLAAGYAHMHGHPATTAIKMPNDPGPEDMTFDEIQSEHKKLNRSVRCTEPNSKFMSEETKRERIDLLKILMSHGLDVAKIEGKLDFPLISEVISTNEPDFIAELTSAGFNLEPEGEDDMGIACAIQHGSFDMVAPLERCGHDHNDLHTVPTAMLRMFRQWQSTGDTSPRTDNQDRSRRPSKKKIEFQWQLDGESVLDAEVDPDLPQAGKSFTLRLSHSNLYGPRPDVRFAMRVFSSSEEETDDEDNWQDFMLVSETLDINGVDTDLASIEKLPPGETPWVGVLETTTTLAEGKHRIIIKVTARDPEACGTLDDWLVDVARSDDVQHSNLDSG